MEPELLRKLDLAAVPAAVEAVFTARVTHEFLPLLRFPEEGRPELETWRGVWPPGHLRDRD